MYDLHTHTTFSDGVLIPAELIIRAKNMGYKGIAITDHADFSNFELIIKNQLKLKDEYADLNFKLLIGIEITHVVPDRIDKLAKLAKEAGADIVVVHGETIVEPVLKGTNKAAVESRYVDILAHPGIISEEDMMIAVKNGKYLEITTRKGHSLTNGHVFKTGKDLGAKFLINNDAHEPKDFVSEKTAVNIVLGAGGTIEDFREMIKNAEEFFIKNKRRH